MALSNIFIVFMVIGEILGFRYILFSFLTGFFVEGVSPEVLEC